MLFRSVGTNGELGDNTIVSKNSPVKVVGNHSFVSVATGYSMCAGLKADGSAWSWGLGTTGQLGDGTILSKSSPVQVVGGQSFTAIAVGSTKLMALKSDGTFWMNGSNTVGELGLLSIISPYVTPINFEMLNKNNVTFVDLDSGWGTMNIKINGGMPYVEFSGLAIPRSKLRLGYGQKVTVAWVE